MSTDAGHSPRTARLSVSLPSQHTSIHANHQGAYCMAEALCWRTHSKMMHLSSDRQVDHGAALCISTFALGCRA